jgi:hypothetical protein
VSSNVTKNLTAVKLEQLKEDAEMIELCCQTAMMGALAGLEAESTKVVEFLSFMVPDSLKIKLTKAYCYMLFGQVHEAIGELKENLTGEHADSQFARSFLNFAEILAGDSKDATILETVAKLPKSPEQMFADQALETLRKTKKIV